MAELEFRDGKRNVADYLATIMRKIETHRYTFNEAIHMANRQLERDHFDAQRSQIIKEHFRNLR